MDANDSGKNKATDLQRETVKGRSASIDVAAGEVLVKKARGPQGIHILLGAVRPGRWYQVSLETAAADRVRRGVRCASRLRGRSPRRVGSAGAGETEGEAVTN
jgi:hypothetical protein